MFKCCKLVINFFFSLQKLQSALDELTQKTNIITNQTREIANLQEQLKQRTNYIVNEDLESRLQSLTQTLLLKQNTIETVITERNALRLQLEKLEVESFYKCTIFWNVRLFLILERIFQSFTNAKK